MNKVIGGEFIIENSLLNENNKPNIEYSSGRSAFFHILQNVADKRGKDSILIPNFLCDSITKTISDIGWKYAFYRINDRLDRKSVV